MNWAQPVEPTPTIDFLPAPTLPADPTEADRGAYEYWLYCMACHGNVGQGLTDEFRALYPPSHQNCWDSGCHGPRPYEGGWTLPGKVPPAIGEAVRAKYANATNLSAFVTASMPWQAPGSLLPESYTRIVAFLARENEFGDEYADYAAIPVDPELTGTVQTFQDSQLLGGRLPSEVHAIEGADYRLPVLAAGAALLLLGLAGVVIWKVRKRS